MMVRCHTRWTVSICIENFDHILTFRSTREHLGKRVTQVNSAETIRMTP